VSFAVPLREMARGFASLAASDRAAERTIVRTMTAHPYLIGGTGRPDSLVMEGYRGQVLAKVGAEGVYGAALPQRGLGIALKVEDGNAWAAVVALLATLDQLELDPPPSSLLPHLATRPVLNTRGEAVGDLRAVGEIEFV
jgi:L-asparaginase II